MKKNVKRCVIYLGLKWVCRGRCVFLPQGPQCLVFLCPQMLFRRFLKKKGSSKKKGALSSLLLSALSLQCSFFRVHVASVYQLEQYKQSICLSMSLTQPNRESSARVEPSLAHASLTVYSNTHFSPKQSGTPWIASWLSCCAGAWANISNKSGLR